MMTETKKDSLFDLTSEAPAVSGVLKDTYNSIFATRTACTSAVAQCKLASGDATITNLARETARRAGTDKITSFVFDTTGKPLCPSVR